MSAPSYTYTLTNGTTADASQVMQDLNDILNGVSDGTKDLTFNALTANAAANLKANVTLGASSSNSLTINGALASSIPIGTTNSYDIGSSTLGLRFIYLGQSASNYTGKILQATLAAARNWTIPDAGSDSSFVMADGNSTVNGTKTFAGQLIGKGTATNDSASSGYIGEWQHTFADKAGSGQSLNNNGSMTQIATIALTAGDWDVSAIAAFSGTPSGFNFAIACVYTTGGADSGSSTTGEQRVASTMGPNANTDHTMSLPTFRVSLTGNQNYYLNLGLSCSSGSITGYGRISARRVR